MNRRSGKPALRRWGRRSVSIPLVLLAFAGLTALLPLLLPAALALDLLRDRRLPVARLVLFAVAYLGCEAVGLLASVPLWIGSIGAPSRRLRWFAGLQREWATALMRFGCAIFGIRVEVSGGDAVSPGPIVVLSRHSSLADTILPAVLISGRTGIRLRWVLKRELLWDPCLDIVGHILPNVFVRRGSGDSGREIEAVRALARDLGAGDGVLIYPEGTRFTPAKQARARVAVAHSDAARATRVAALEHLLPPRPGGPVALLDACPPADVVLLAHVGLDGAATLGDLWRGALVGRTVAVDFRRIAGTGVPAESDARLDWLDREWLVMDRWIGGRLGETAGGWARGRA